MARPNGKDVRLRLTLLHEHIGFDARHAVPPASVRNLQRGIPPGDRQAIGRRGTIQEALVLAEGKQEGRTKIGSKLISYLIGDEAPRLRAAIFAVPQ